MILSGTEVTLDALAERINTEHDLCVGAARTSLQHAMAAGALLIEAKAQVRHGEWLTWLEANCAAPESTVRLYMQLARDLPARLEQDKTLTVSDLGIREARALLAEPSSSDQPLRPAFAESSSADVLVRYPQAFMADARTEEPESDEEEEEDEPQDIHERVRRMQMSGVEEEYIIAELEQHIDALEYPAPAPVLPLTQEVATQRATAETLSDRFKREDVVHRALQALEHMMRFDAAEAARLHGGSPSLSRHLLQNDIDTAQEAVTWLGTYIEALSAHLGVSVRRGPTLLQGEEDARAKA